MKVTKEIAKKTAHLARLRFDETNEEQLVDDLQQMVDWMDQLNEVDTEGVTPLTNMSFEINSLREDTVKGHIEKGEAFKNAPKHDNQYFKVPKVINK